MTLVRVHCYRWDPQAIVPPADGKIVRPARPVDLGFEYHGRRVLGYGGLRRGAWICCVCYGAESFHARFCVDCPGPPRGRPILSTDGLQRRDPRP